MNEHRQEQLSRIVIKGFKSIKNCDVGQLLELKNIRRRAATPEHINDKYETAPSRRIIGQISDYSKIRNGIEIAQRIGIEKMTDECVHFKQWIANLTAWAKEGAL